MKSARFALLPCIVLACDAFAQETPALDAVTVTATRVEEEIHDGPVSVDVVPGGAQRAVGYDERLEYARLEEQYRLHEFDAQAAAVRAGLATIVPARLLALFTWEEIEVMEATLAEAIEMIRSGRIVDGKTIAALLMFERFVTNG